MSTNSEIIQQEGQQLNILELNQKLWPFPELPQQQLKEQYQSQKETFQRIGLLTELYPHTFGLSSEETIDGQSYPFPSFEEIIKTMIKNKDILSIKITQKFNRLLLVPIALNLSVFQDKIGSFIQTKKRQGQLLGTETPRGNEFIELELDRDNPLFISKEIIKGEQSGDLLYHVQQFDNQHHRGFTKQQLMIKLAVSPFPGYEVLLLPQDMYLPKEGKGQIKGQGTNQRKQLENNDTSKNYLKTITDPDPDSPYRHELGLTIEAGLTDFALYLAKTNHIKYDWNDQSGINLIGNYLKTSHTSGLVPNVRWDRDYGQLGVGRNASDGWDERWGCLSAVRVFPLKI